MIAVEQGKYGVSLLAYVKPRGFPAAEEVLVLVDAIEGDAK